MKRVDDFRLRFGKQELVPIIIGGMGVDISTAELALEVARLGGIGHISDALVQDVSDRRFDTKFVREKTKHYKANVDNATNPMCSSTWASWTKPPASMSAKPWKPSTATA